MTISDATKTLTIDVWADIACPWCWIGERRLQAGRPEVRVEQRWRPYQLQPQLPREGMEWGAFVREKFGGEARAAGMFQHVANAGAGEQLDFRFDRVAVAPNTADAHRLVLWAAGQAPRAGADADGSAALAMADALFRAYFADGRNVSDRGVLADVAAEQGLDRAAAAAMLASDAHALEVQGALREAARLGIRGVPFVVLDERLAISGAQPSELFDRALSAALEG